MPTLTGHEGDDRGDLLRRIWEAQEKDNLTDWEAEFLDDLYERVEEGVTLTGKQLNKLKEIEEKEGFYPDFDGWDG